MVEIPTEITLHFSAIGILSAAFLLPYIVAFAVRALARIIQFRGNYD